MRSNTNPTGPTLTLGEATWYLDQWAAFRGVGDLPLCSLSAAAKALVGGECVVLVSQPGKQLLGATSKKEAS